MQGSCSVEGVGRSQRKDQEEEGHCWASEECNPVEK